MALVFHLIVLLGLWMGANATCSKKEGCCMTCPEGWTRLNSRCFKFNYDPKEWDSAESDCILQGGNLASIHSTLDYKLLRDMVKAATGVDKQTWVGGSDAVKEGCWKWSDGSPFNYKNWGPKEPNNFKMREHCLELNYDEKDHGNDWFCDRKRSYICSRDMEVQVKP